jgi:hypothetical protein
MYIVTSLQLKLQPGVAPFFGVPLKEIMVTQTAKDVPDKVPVIVSRCIEYLLPAHSMYRNSDFQKSHTQILVKEEGLFRKSGSQSDIIDLKEVIEREEGIFSRDVLATVFDCHNITGTNKKIIS